VDHYQPHSNADRSRLGPGHLKDQGQNKASDSGTNLFDRLRVGWLNGRGTARAEDAQGTPSQSHISPSILTSVRWKKRLPRFRYTTFKNPEWGGSLESSPAGHDNTPEVTGPP